MWLCLLRPVAVGDLALWLVLSSRLYLGLSNVLTVDALVGFLRPFFFKFGVFFWCCGSLGAS